MMSVPVKEDLFDPAPIPCKVSTKNIIIDNKSPPPGVENNEY